MEIKEAPIPYFQNVKFVRVCSLVSRYFCNVYKSFSALTIRMRMSTSNTKQSSFLYKKIMKIPTQKGEHSCKCMELSFKLPLIPYLPCEQWLTLSVFFVFAEKLPNYQQIQWAWQQKLLPGSRCIFWRREYPKCYLFKKIYMTKSINMVSCITLQRIKNLTSAY